jgi:CIC family chloride channel protein
VSAQGRTRRHFAEGSTATDAPATTAGPGGPATPVRGWLASSRLGLVVVALIVGAGAGLGAVGFRWLIFTFTWIVTGHKQFGQQGHAASLHLPFLGPWFVLVVPVVAGLLYGPLIHRFAREARGHGVPEVMLAVAENGGRIRPQVTVVKALASAMCIGAGGSVGREGPIVQIGSALASTVGQVVRMAESRLRVTVACGAAAAIAATFNAPLTGLLFGFEIVLREFSLDALFATGIAAVTGDVISRAFFGSAPFFTGAPHNLSVANDWVYLLIAVLGVIAGLIGIGFKTFLYWLEEVADELWHGRPEWARPAVGGVALGVVLLALPQMYGVGYPVMDRVLGGQYVLWFVLILLVGKILAASVTLSIGGSGGVFAPSLFMGAAAGTAFGVIVDHLFGASVGPAGMYGVVAMGAVFAGAAQAPLTAIASVAEMTGNFTLMLPIVLANGIAVAVSKQISYGSIYTTKLLRRGIDIERPRPTSVLQRLTVAEVMQPLIEVNGHSNGTTGAGTELLMSEFGWEQIIGPVMTTETPQILFTDEDLEHAMRQLVLFGREGLPVLSHETGQLRGWITRADALAPLVARVDAASAEIELGAEASAEIERGAAAPALVPGALGTRAHVPTTPLSGYRLVELEVANDSPAVGRPISEIRWPRATIPVARSSGDALIAVRQEDELHAGERLIVLAPADDDAQARAGAGNGSTS